MLHLEAGSQASVAYRMAIFVLCTAVLLLAG